MARPIVLLRDCDPVWSTFEQYDPSECRTHKRRLYLCEAVASDLRAMTKEVVR